MLLMLGICPLTLFVTHAYPQGVQHQQKQPVVCRFIGRAEEELQQYSDRFRMWAVKVTLTNEVG
jgi:hypothetical protein